MASLNNENILLKIIHLYLKLFFNYFLLLLTITKVEPFCFSDCNKRSFTENSATSCNQWRKQSYSCWGWSSGHGLCIQYSLAGNLL